MQEKFLNEIISEKITVTVFIANGFQLRGIITDFDDDVVIVVSDGREQMVYKHAISTIAY